MVKDSQSGKTEKGVILTSFNISSAQVRRVVYQGTELIKLREKTGLSQAEFAARCGWSQQYQSRLELPFEQEINLDKMEVINRTAEEEMRRQV
jgi:predicted transcriptional regulator